MQYPFTMIKYILQQAHNCCVKYFPMEQIAGIENETGFTENDMLATECQLNSPQAIFVDDDSQIYIADTHNHCLGKLIRME